MKNEIKNGIVVIPLEGSVVGAHINVELLDLIKSNMDSGNKTVLFNMAGMKFIDSTGLGTLLTAVSRIKAAGGKLALCSVPDQMRKLLIITKLESAFNQQPDEDAALMFLTHQ